MDFKPHPEKARRAIVTVNNLYEHAEIAFTPMLNFRRQGLVMLLEMSHILPDPVYPQEFSMSYRQLHRVATYAIDRSLVSPPVASESTGIKIAEFLDRQDYSPMLII
jgi:hypothetical protein